MKKENLDAVLYELMQADSLDMEEEEVEMISFSDGGYHTILCC